VRPRKRRRITSGKSRQMWLRSQKMLIDISLVYSARNSFEGQNIFTILFSMWARNQLISMEMLQMKMIRQNMAYSWWCVCYWTELPYFLLLTESWPLLPILLYSVKKLTVFQDSPWKWVVSCNRKCCKYWQTYRQHDNVSQGFWVQPK
jgi:hypothetical protein